MPPSLRPKNSIFSYWHSHTHCENNQWTLRASNGRNLESTVTLEPRTSTQCWPYHTSPVQCSDHENHTYCTPTLGRLEKTLLQSSTDITNWEDWLQYEPFYKAYFQELEPPYDIFRYYKKLIQACQIADFFNMKWFSLHSTHLTNWNTSHTLTPMNFSSLENQMQQILMEFDQQYNFTMGMVKNYEYYRMQAQQFDSLLLRLVVQLELITDTNDRLRLSQTMTALSKKASTAERSQLWIRSIIKRHVQTLRSNLERYYVLRTIQQSLSALDKITDLHRDIIYQHQFRNGKIISFPKYRIADPITTTEGLLTTMPSSAFVQTTTSTTSAVTFTQTTTPATLPTMKEQGVTTSSAETTEEMTTMVSTTTQPDIDWEKVNELDEQEAEKHTEISTLILSSIVDTLMAIGSTIVYGIYQLCTSSTNTMTSNITSAIS